jgi:hypothetical protein
MSVTLDISQEALEELESTASAQGLTVSALVESLVHHKRHLLEKVVSKPVQLSKEQWIKEFLEWTASHRHLPYEADDSRESIYAGEGE